MIYNGWKNYYLSFHLLPTVFPLNRVQVAGYLLPRVLGKEQVAGRVRSPSNLVLFCEHRCDYYPWSGGSRSLSIACTAATASPDGDNVGEFANGCNSWCSLIRG